MLKDIKKYSPITEAVYYILLALTKPLHGYGVIKKVELISDNRITIAAGTLYGAFKSLEKSKLIEFTGTDPDNDRRKIYQITNLGLELLKFEVDRVSSMAKEGIKELEGFDV